MKSTYHIQYLILKFFANRFDLFNCNLTLRVMVLGLERKVRGNILLLFRAQFVKLLYSRSHLTNLGVADYLKNPLSYKNQSQDEITVIVYTHSSL